MRMIVTLVLTLLATPSAFAQTEFIYGHRPGNGNRAFFDLTGTPERIVFTGRVNKGPTHDPRVLGGQHRLVNRSGAEYRVVAYEIGLDQSRLIEGESVESDIALTIHPPGLEVSLSSGNEMLVTHQYDSPISSAGVQRTVLPAGGFALPPEHSLSAASVSAVFPNDKSGAALLDPNRISDGRFMSMYYKFELVRADLVNEAPVTSYRSPYRDRSYVPEANRKHAPYTDFINNTDHPVHVRGLGIFLSNMSSYEPSAHSVEVRVDNKVAVDMPLPPHIPGKSSPALPLMMPLELVVQPGQTIGIRGRVDTNKAIVFDFAAYLVADVGLDPFQERLDVVQFDVNKDGYDDIIDIDQDGSIWVSVRVGEGYQNTQHEWLRKLGKIDSLEVAKDAHALIAKNADGLCLHLEPRHDLSLFLPSYCGEPVAKEPELWGDFNGDGWPDRFTVDEKAPSYNVALGSPDGLKPPVVWASGYGQVERWFPYDGDADGLTDMLAQWHDTEGFQCIIWKSNGTAFDIAKRTTVPNPPPTETVAATSSPDSSKVQRVAERIGRHSSLLYLVTPIGLGALWLTWSFRPRREGSK